MMTLQTISEGDHPDQDDITNDETIARKMELEADFRQKNIPKGFRIDEDGLWFDGEVDADGNQPLPIFISKPLFVTAIVRNQANEDHGVLLEFQDSDGHGHCWSMPMELLAGDGREFRGELLRLGLRIAPGSKPRQLLAQYIQLCQPVARARCVSQTGWFGDCFVFPDETIGVAEGEQVLFQSLSHNHLGYGQSGSLENWIDITEFCRDNSRLLLALSVSFAAPLLHFAGEESGGFHFRGPSSTGKTTALHVACSLWGGPEYLKRWRATVNGLEGLATGHNDTLLCLDEIEEIQAADIGTAAYMLANGAGKTRADRYGTPRKKSTWRLFFLSTGEISLPDHIRQGGRMVRAGQEVRVVDIPADTGKHGMFEELHGFSSGAELAEHLTQICRSTYGVAGRKFLTRLVEDRERFFSRFREFRANLHRKYLPKSASGQVKRVFNRFAIVAAAGELATVYGLTGWKEGEAEQGVMKCFEEWLRVRGDVGMIEVTRALTQVRRFFEQHGESRFSPWEGDSTDRRTINRAGYKRTEAGETEFFVFSETFRTEICNGLDHVFIAKQCIAQGWLIPEKGGKATRTERIPGHCKIRGTRCYRFTSKVLADECCEDGADVNEL